MDNLPKITPDMVSAYQAELEANSSPSTARRKAASLKKFFIWAQEQGHITENPYPQQPQTSTNIPSYYPPAMPEMTPVVASNEPKKKGYGPYIFTGGMTLALLVLIFLLIGKVKLPIPFEFPSASEDKSKVVDNSGTNSSAIIASAYKIFADLSLKDVNGQPIITPQTVSFKVYSSSNSPEAIFTTQPQQITPSGNGSVSTVIENVPTEYFFENKTLFIAPVTAQGELSERIPVSTANVASNLQGYYPKIEATSGSIPVIGSDGSLIIASDNPAIKGKTGTLLIEGKAITIASPTASDGDITINPDGSGTLNLITEGSSGNMINATNSNLNSGTLYSGIVANNSTGYYLIKLQSGSTPSTKFSVDAQGNTYMAGSMDFGGGLKVGGIERITSLGKLTNISGLSGSGIFNLSQSASDYFGLTKTGVTAATDSATLNLNEVGHTASGYDTLVLSRTGGTSDSYALNVANGNSRFAGNVTMSGSLDLGGILQLGNFSSTPGSAGEGSVIYNTSDNTVYVYDGSTWNPVGSGGSSDFASLTSGTNTGAAMVVGTGASLSASGTGTIEATGLTCTGCVLNNELANSSITVSGDSGSSAVSLGGTLSIVGGEGIDTSESSGTVTITGEDATDTNKGIASFGSDFTVTAGNVMVANNALNFSELSNSLVLDASTDIALSTFALSTTGSGALDFNSTGQVSFTGNVDAENGLDVTNANLTVGGANFSVAYGNGNITTAGDLAVNGGDITSSAATLVINAGGNVDIQDTLNVNNLTTDTGGVSIASGQSYTGLGAVTLSSANATALTVDSGTTGNLNIGTGVNDKSISIGNNSSNTSITLTKGSSGNLTLTDFDCSTYTNGGKLTTDASGNIICDNDDSTSGGSGSVVWSDLTNPANNLSLSHSAYTTTMGWTATGALNAWTMNFTNNASSANTQNAFTINNAATSQTNDVNTEALLLLNNSDTSASGSTVVNNAILITNSGGITNGITDAIDASATEIVNALNFGANTLLGTTGDIDMTYFDVTGANGNIVTAGTLAVNGDSITSDGATLTINASGTVDVQDTLNADEITTDTGGVTIAASQSYSGLGAVTYRSANATALTINSGTTGAINIGTDASAEVISIGTGTADKTFTIGSVTGGSVTYIQAGTSGLNIGDDAVSKTIDIGGTDYDAANTIRIGTGATSADTISIGNNNASTTLALTGGDDWSIDASGNIVTAGDLAVNGGDITSSGNLTINSGGIVIIPDADTLQSNDITSTGALALSSSLAAGGTTTEAFSIKATTNLNQTDELLQIGDSGGDFLTIDGAGNIGIATATDANTKLYVNQAAANSTGIAAYTNESTAVGPGGVNVNTAIHASLVSSGGITADGTDVAARSLTGGAFIVEDSGALTDGGAGAIKQLVGVGANVTDSGTHTSGESSLYGGFFSATGVSVNVDSTAYGLFATATGADTNWAGYFDGNIGTTGDLVINGGDITSSATTFNFDIGNTGTLNFGDGTNTLMAIKDQGAYPLVNIAGKTDTGDPATCAEGDIYYNAFDDTLKVCHSGNTWEGLDGGGSSTWDSIAAPVGDLTLDMANYDTTFNWTNTGAINAFVMTLTNDASSSTTQNLLTLQNALSAQTTDVNTEALLLLDNADTSATGSTVINNAILVTNSGGIASGIIDALDASATEIDNALNAGANFILYDGVRAFSNTSGQLTYEDTSGNDLIRIEDQGTTGRLMVSDSLQVGGTTTAAFSRIGTAATTHSGQIASSNDLLLSGDFELDGGLYLDNGNIYNAQGTATILFCTAGGADCATTDQIQHTLTGGSWNIDNSANVGKAALMVNNQFAGDLFTASASGVTKFRIQNNGNVTIDGSGTMFTVGGGSGKIDVGTVDPVYNIGGTKYATYMTAMTGVKEETTGLVNTNTFIPGIGYSHTIDFTQAEKGSDEWLFAKAVDIENNMDKMVVLLSPSSNTRTWYEIDPDNYRMTVYSSIPTQISYRLTAPRFDYALWSNYNDNPDSIGFVLDDTDLVGNGSISLNPQLNFADYQLEKTEVGYQLKYAGNRIVAGFESVANQIVGNIKAGYIETQELLTQSLESTSVKTNLISPLSGETDIRVQIGSATESGVLAIQDFDGNTVSSFDSEGNASFSGELTAKRIVADEIIGGNTLTKEEIENLLRNAEEDILALQNNLEASVNTATDSANLENVTATNMYLTGSLITSAITTSNTLTVGNDFVISSDEEGGLASIAINTLTTPLKIQSLAMAPIEIMAGKFRIDTDGNVNINGNLYVAGKIYSNGLSLEATVEEQKLLTLSDMGKNEVASVDASGSALFGSLTTDKIVIAGSETATDSAVVNGEISTNATAGKTYIPANTNEITINNPKITNYTLVYVTPTSDTQNKVLYVKEKGDGYFKVGFTSPILTDVNFNWWIIEIKPQ